MTQQEIIKEIKSFPILEQFKIVEEIQNNIKQSLTAETDKKKLSVNKKLAIVEELGGALKMKNPPMTKEQERLIIEAHLAEKLK